MSTPPYGYATEHDFGQDFNYAVWSPNSTLSFHNVPWNNDYRDIVYYPTQSALDAYLDTVKGPSYNDASYLKATAPVIVGLPFNQCYKYNYLRVTNPAQPLGSGVDVARTFYYFITDVTYESPQATRISVQLDVWQTFSRFVKFGRCYIERGHIGIANANQFDDHGRKYLTVPEGLDTGNEYVVSNHMEYVVAQGSNQNFQVMITSAVALDIDDPGDAGNPHLETASGSFFENLPSGCEVYLSSMTNFIRFMKAAADAPWITQGIQSITVIPNTAAWGIDNPGYTGGFEPVAPFGVPMSKVTSGDAMGALHKVADNWRSGIAIPSRYSNLLKFKTYPYTVLEMTSYTGTPVILKPEALAMDDLYVGYAYHLVQPGARLIFYPFKYNGKAYSSDSAALADKSSDPLPNDFAEYIDVTTGIFNLPQFSIVNDGYLSYMAANAHRIGYAYQSADWSQQRAMINATGQYQIADVGLTNQYDAMRIERAALIGQLQNNTTNKMAGAGMGAVAGLANAGIAGLGGNVGSAASQLIGAGTAVNQAGVSAITDLANGAIQVGAMTGVAGLQRQTSENARDTNYYMSTRAAKGDYANEIAGINARVQDAHLIQPSTSGQIGGDAFNIAMGKWGVFFRIKTLQAAVQYAIGEFWLRYGYAINRFGVMPSNFKVMEKFTYWKLRETYITSAQCPETYKQAIRGIFEKGVTVWTTPGDIGNIDIADNDPLDGVTL